ncbi:MAG: TonB-dependent receptor [Pseudomonadota bacterium]
MGLTVRNRRATSALCSVASCLALATATPAAVAQEPVDAAAAAPIDIPAGPLGNAINSIVRIYGVNVLVDESLVEGRDAPAVSGELTINGALDALLAGSGLEATYLTDGTVVIARQRAATDADAPVDAEVRTADTIVVTGQKRERTLLESDVSATVLGARDIEELRLRDIRRLDDVVPNVQFAQGSQVSPVFASIRGIESNPAIVNRAAIYIDGVPFRELSNAVLDQIESIEVLRGPQSTLYGANSEAGLFIINSRQPTEAFEAEFRADASAYNGDYAYNFSGFAGGPLIEDTLFGSVVVSYTNEDSFLQNPFAPEVSTAEIRDTFVQGRLTFTPNDSLTIKATAYYLDVEAPGLYEGAFAPIDTAAFDDNIAFDPFTQQVLGPYIDVFHEGREIGDWEFFSDTDQLTEERDVVAGFSLTQDVGDGKIDLAASYSNLDADSFGLDIDFSAFPLQVGFANDELTVWSGELRYTSPDSDVFEYIVGVSFYKDERVSERNVTFADPFNGGFLPFDEIPELFAESEDYAVFGSGSFGLGAPGLKGTIGLRYDNATRRASQEGYEVTFGQQTLFLLDAEGETTFEQWLPRFSVNYEASDRFSVFASASRGYIPGGFNIAASADPTVAEDIFRFDEEKIWNYEIGVKTIFPDGRGYLNAAVFYIESDGWQEVQLLTDPVTGSITTPTFLSADADIVSKGFEIEGVYRPINNLKISASFGYTDAEYRNFDFEVGARGQIAQIEDLSGAGVKLVPEYDLNVSALYEFSWGGYVRGEINGQGDMPLEERTREIDPFADRAVQEAVTRFNLYAGYETAGYSLSVFAENITDERVVSGLAFQNLFFGNDGTFYGPLDAPRVVGVEVEARF